MAAATNPNTYYRYRQYINCATGGYVEDYNLRADLWNPGTLPPAGALAAAKQIYTLRGQLLEGNSKIANAEISIETLPGANPAEGFQIPHGITGSVPILLNDPTSGVVETIPGVAIDSEQSIAFRIDTRRGFSELRTLRSLRASWVQQWPVLYPQIVAKLGQWGAVLPPAGVFTGIFPTDNGTATNPATCIAYFMLVVLVNTSLVQDVKSAGTVTGFTFTNYQAPSSVLSPQVINPIVSAQLTRRKIGEGWPKTKGKAQNFGTHG